MTAILLVCCNAPAVRAQSAASSMDLFGKGSAFYLRRDFRNAAVYLQQALDLEKEHPSLSRNYWRVLVDNLAMAYGISGDLKRSHEVLEYGISRDPVYPNFHYTLACAYAEDDDLDHALAELDTAFKYKANRILGEAMPDPRIDDSFRRFQNNERFRSLMTSLYGDSPRQEYPSKVTLSWPRPANSPQLQAQSPGDSQVRDASQEGLREAVPPARADRASVKVPQSRRICFIPLAGFPTSELGDLAAYYRQRFDLEIDILGSIRIPEGAFDNRRQQLIAERLIKGLHHSLPELARDPSAILIAFTDQDMYPLGENWRFAFGWRDGTVGTAVVSTARMDLHYPGEPAPDARPEVRLRKMVTKDIGILYYELPQNRNPRSVLYDGILGIEELDAVSEDF